MEWKKLKNLIILILLVVNGFLLVLVWARRQESVSYERLALERTVRVLENSGIEVDLSACAPGDGLASISVERGLAREEALARALLGEGAVQAENRGGGLYLYQGSNGELSVRAGGELSANMADDPSQLVTEDLERHASGLLKRMGVDVERIGVAEEDEWTRVRFRQVWNGVPVFSCEVEVVYYYNLLYSVQGTLLTAQAGTAEAGQALTLPTALMRFSEEIAATGDVCTAVRAMEPGYRGTVQSLSGGVRLSPVWLVTTDTARYYLDCATGALTRV
ncbi:MAG: hypothetical protein HFF29_07400 [Oscillospiraceae bacterium]|nr:hypothetical protein [Oscillospiraceae bacterium]